MRIFLLLILFSFCHFQAQSLRINEYMASNSSVIQDEDGDYSDWMELYNPTGNLINLLNFAISDDIDNPRKWIFPNVDIEAGGYLVVFASDKDKTSGELHTNFKISASGEELVLTNNEGQIINNIDPTPMQSNTSLGRSLTDPSQWLFFTTSTPGGPNNTEGFTAFSESPTFSVVGGFYSSSISLELSTVSGSNEVYFTTDGSDPSKSSTNYTEPIIINSTQVVRARVFETDLLPSRIITHTYIFNENTSLPVISLSTNPDNLWDDEIGIYVEGTNGIAGNCMETPANWNQEWERPIHIEFFETDKSLAFSIDAGVQIHGGCSRKTPQKSLAIIARGEYGSKDIPYQVFPNMSYDSYQSILLRNAGQDNWYAFMRDPLFHTLVEDLDLETQAYRPSIVFLNGDYWGIYNIRERTNDDYLARRQGVDKDNLDILRRPDNIVEGDNLNYLALLDYLENNNIGQDIHYNYIKTQMDIDSYINYLLVEMYVVNTDWYANNMKFWRPRTSDGKWRWILFDTDDGFDLWSQETVDKDMVGLVSNIYREPAVIFNNLIVNDHFREKFINTFADFANTRFTANPVISAIDSIKSVIEPEIPRQIQKWGVPWQQAWGIGYWHEEIQRLKDFANERLPHMYQHFISKFSLGGIAQVNLNVNDIEKGFIVLNSIDIKSFPWSGSYFRNQPITLEAKPKPGYKFVSWSGDVVSSERVISYTPSPTNNITAVFELDDQAFSIVINEINYNPPDTDVPERTDWIELFNNSDNPVDIGGWKLKDEDGIYTFPNGTIIAERDYIVVADDFNTFLNYYSTVTKVINESSGLGLSGKGEELSLFSLNGTLIDTVEYNDKAPWPTSPDGDGPTLELKHPDLNNIFGENWNASTNNFGTPGEANSTIQRKVTVDVKVYIEGAYTGLNTMYHGLSESSQIPLNQPFNLTPWFYEGSEQLIELPNEEITDWIFVELREETSSTTVQAKRAALLKNDGTIADLDGESDLAFYDLDPGDYYIIVHHRNHLSIMSSSKITIPDYNLD